VNGATGTSSKSQVGPCYWCGKMGHLANACPDARLNAMHATHDEEVDERRNHQQDEDNAPGNEPTSKSSGTHEQERNKVPSDDDAYYAEMYECYSYEESASDLDSKEDNEGAHFGAMRASAPSKAPPKTEDRTFRSGIHRLEPQKEYPAEDRDCLAAYIEIGGLRALTLFDTGANLDAVSPAFAENCESELVELVQPVRLDLGCKGSKSKINYATWANTKVGPVDCVWWFDVRNIARYDAVVGMPFCKQNGVVIDVPNWKITVQGEVIDVLEVGKGMARHKNKFKSQSHSFRAQVSSN
jgi:hypothetical protein